jgi:hypothetical protein
MMKKSIDSTKANTNKKDLLKPPATTAMPPVPSWEFDRLVKSTDISG